MEMNEFLRAIPKVSLHLHLMGSVQARTAVDLCTKHGVMATVSRMMQDRIQAEHMENGVTLVDPATTWIEAGARIEPDTVVLPFTFIEGSVTIGRHCRVGPFAHVRKGTVLQAGASADADASCRPVSRGAKAHANTG